MVDAKNKVVGRAVAWPHGFVPAAPFQALTENSDWSVLYETNGIWFLLPIDPANGFSSTPDFLLFYTQQDCQGTVYTYAPGAQPDFAADATATSNPIGSTNNTGVAVGILKGMIYYPNGPWPGQTVIPQSYLGVATAAAPGELHCENFSNGQFPNMVPAGSMPVPAGFTPPFRLQ
jgi:hypothetical protein